MAEKMQTREIPLDQVAELLDRSVSGFDEERAGDLAEMSELESAHAVLRNREAERLSRKLGAQHPRVLKLRARAELGTAVAKEAQIAQTRATTQVPRIDERSWAVYGYVTDSQRQPVAGVIVAPYARGKWVEALGHTCTDEKGYYVLRYTPGEKQAEGEPQDLADLLCKIFGGAEHAPQQIQVHMRALGRDGTTLGESDEPVEVQAGQRFQRNIVTGHATCPPPPGGIATKGPTPPTHKESDTAAPSPSLPKARRKG